MIELRLPNQNLLDLVKQGVEEIKNNPCEFDTYTTKSFIAATQENMDTYFDNLENERKGINLKDGISPQTEFWMFEKNKFVGFLTPHLICFLAMEAEKTKFEIAFHALFDLFCRLFYI